MARVGLGRPAAAALGVTTRETMRRAVVGATRSAVTEPRPEKHAPACDDDVARTVALGVLHFIARACILFACVELL